MTSLQNARLRRKDRRGFHPLAASAGPLGWTALFAV